jgi:hypothetical protein
MITFAVTPRTAYLVECRRQGRLVWEERFPNLVTTAGLNKLLDATFKSGLGSYAWYVGLVDNTSFSAYAVADTMGAHAGWIESVAYSNATRPGYTPGVIAAGAVNNSEVKATYNINTIATLKGAFLTTVSTKGGTTGTLYGVGSFANTRSVIVGDVVSVTITLSIG